MHDEEAEQVEAEDATNTRHSPTTYAVRRKEEVDRVAVETVVVFQSHQEVQEQLANMLRKPERTPT